MEEFTNAARGLTKNPLGIIGLFVVLVYGLACLVLGISAAHLEQSERWPLILFIVLFPILILAVFFRLVTAHHVKLYAPSDFRDERNFMSEPLSDQRRTERLESEIQRIEEEEITTAQTGAHHREEALPSAVPEPNASNLVQIPPTLHLRSTYADAERLAFLELEKEIGKPFQKYVRVSLRGMTAEFDGVLTTSHESHLVEVKYFSRPQFKREFLEALILRATIFSDNPDSDITTTSGNVTLWIAIVTGFSVDQFEDFKSKVKSSVMTSVVSKLNVNLRFYNLYELKSKYG